jgi:hypothetical protein
MDENDIQNMTNQYDVPKGKMGTLFGDFLKQPWFLGGV